MYRIDYDYCISCELCSTVAPDNIRFDGGEVMIYKQPDNEEEIDLMNIAVEDCPEHILTEENNG